MILILHIITSIVGVVEILLALYFWITNSGSRIRWIIGLVSFSMGGWVLLNVLTSYHDRTAFTDAIIPFLFFVVVVLFISIVHLSLEFPYPMFRIDRLHILLLYLPALLFAYLIFFTNDIVFDYRLDRLSTGYIIPGNAYPLFAGLILVAMIATFSLLGYKLQRVGGTHRRNVLLVILSFLIPGLPALYLVLTREAVGANYNSLISPVLSSVWLGITMYIVVKK